MTGPEHYRRGEALLAAINNENFQDVDSEGRVVEFYDEGEDIANVLAAAPAHFTAALVAVNALAVTALQPPHVSEVAKDWRAAISPAVDEPVEEVAAS